MSCQGQSNLIARISGRFAGLPWLAGKSAYLVGSSTQVSFFDPPQTIKDKDLTRSKQTTPEKVSRRKKKRADKPNGQASFFSISADKRDQFSNAQKKEQPVRPDQLPTQRQVKITDYFSTEELQVMSVQLRLGAAAVSRRIRELNSGASRGIGHSDPRPLDWARSDQKNFQFLAKQITTAHRGRDYIDTSSLSNNELVDMWNFSRFEADRASRNIDHLQAGLGHLKGPTSDYLIERHRLEARFYTLLAGRLQSIVTPEMQV